MPSSDPNQAAFQQNQAQAVADQVIAQRRAQGLTPSYGVSLREAERARQQPSTWQDLGPLNPQPLASAIWQQRGLLDPMPLLRALGRGARDIGVEGANAGLDMMGVPRTDFQSPLQNWIDRQLAEPGQEPPPPPDPEAQRQIALRGLAIDHANAMKEITNQSLPPAHYDSLVQQIQTDPHGFLKSLGINRGAQ